MENKRIGRKSSAQDNFIGPNPVTNLTATNVPSGRAFNDGRIDLSWTNPTTGNTPTVYRIFRDGSSLTTVNHPTNTYSDTGRASNTSYSYYVRAEDSFNNAENSNTASATATTVPATPGAPSATAGVNQDTVSWSAPANGGSAITGYIWAATDGKTNAAGGTPGGGPTTSTSVTVSQEANTAQTYTVYAINANGNSGVSAASNSVTTLAPSFFTPPFFPPAFFAPPFFPPVFFSPPFFPPVFFTPPFFPPVFFTPPFFPPVFFTPPFFPPLFFFPPFFPPIFFSPPFFPPAFFSPPFFPPAFFSPPFFPPIFFVPPAFSGGGGIRFY